ncbi:UDP-N-acetyl-D-mannosamine dehydrogenase [Candidatus Villigracilis saccharophilus]|uniref:UDP-N-acetyl-D-mannosamine dehydrogenase n=1 Tax=Candidatus Villigracilis saccharophilus TaxID=3140684 RepID=UPI0031364284|nr:UDP-N-acetyl-D-mannosamine dehydrogenase [Anaerolineales bacterium]
MNFQKICVIGLGYIGLPTASTFAAHGINVLGVDISPHIVETINKGEIHIHEPGLLEEVKKAIQSGNFKAAAKPEEADAFIIAVPTPFQENKFGEYNGLTYKLADMRAVTSAAESIVPFLRKGNLVVLESTSPPRTTVDLVAPILARSGLEAGRDFHLAYSPERVLPGQILRELIENARVIGGVTSESSQAGRDLYATFVKGQIIQTDATTAEMVKLMENTYRDVNIAIANEFSRLADKFGVDVWEAISIANLHPRVKILSPGPGVGGHCISVDPWFLVESAPELTPLIYNARQVNDAQPNFVVKLVQRALGSLNEKKIAVLGLAYKPDVDDVRESPATEVIHILQHTGAQVKAWEPFKLDANMKGVDMASSLEDAIKDADAVILLVKHTEFTTLNPNELAQKTKARIVIDTVNGWNDEVWKNAGFTLFRLGNNKSKI